MNTLALEILKRFSARCESAMGFGGIMVASLGEIKDAIAEIEALKTCEGCKYDSERRFDCYKWSDCDREHTRKPRVDRYEPKEEL